MVRTSVLIVNWKTLDDLGRCLASLREHEGDVGTYVFQNHYTDEIDEASEDLAQSLGCQTMRSADNIGHGSGINRLALLLDVQESDYLFIVNPDVVWTEPVIDRLVSFLQAEPSAAMVGPKQMDSKGRITAGGIIGTMEAPLHRMFHAADPQNVKVRDIQPVIVVAGSALMVTAKDFYELGGMLPARHYYSETWLCYHALAHGRTNWYWGEPTMIHEWHSSTRVGDPNSDGKFREDQELFRHMCDTHDPPIPHD